jgi:agmatine deiminase
MTVYLSSALSVHGGVLGQITYELRQHHVEYVLIDGTANPWIRDWAPIRCGDHYVKFRPKADTVRWPHLKVLEECFHQIEELGWVNWRGANGDSSTITDMVEDDFRVSFSNLILDGGNVMRSPDGKRAIVTEMALYDNIHHDYGGKGGKATFEELLEAEIIWIPAEPGDDLGHADGIVQWVDDNTVLLNNYGPAEDAELNDYEDHVAGILIENHLQAVEFPWFGYLAPDITEAEFREKFPLADDFNPGWGWAINFLHVDDLILYPTFGIEGDTETMETLAKWFPAHSLAPIDCQSISMEGGLVHCVTWTWEC